MFAFGESVKRLPKDLAAERARIRKGKVWGRKRLDDVHTTDNLVLPDITSTQLTQNYDTMNTSWEEARERMNGKDRKAMPQQIKRGRLRDSTFMLGESGASRVEELEGLFVSKLTFQSGTEISDESDVSPFGSSKKLRKQRSRLSKTDSGFFEDSGDEIMKHSVPPCTPNDSDNVSNDSVPATPQKTPKLTLNLKAILNQDKTIVRNTEKLTTRANMCLQSTQSLHADLVAYRSLATHHKGAISNYTLQTNEQCVKLREVVLKTKTNSHDEGVKQSDTSLAVLKTRRRLLGKQNSCPPFPFMQRRNKERVADLSRTTYNCKHHIQFAELERLHLRQCKSCPVDVYAPQIQDRIKSAIDISAGNLDCAVSTQSGLTEKALLETSQSQETVDVNEKCQEWLNRWIAFNHAPQTVTDNYSTS